jgi:hypothetical protein
MEGRSWPASISCKKTAVTDFAQQLLSTVAVKRVGDLLLPFLCYPHSMSLQGIPERASMYMYICG